MYTFVYMGANLFAHVIYNAYLCDMKDFLMSILVGLIMIGLALLGIGAIAILVFILRPLFIVLFIGSVFFVLYLIIIDLFD